MAAGKYIDHSGMAWVPWIRWEDNTIQCAPAGLDTMEQVEEYAERKSIENGMKYLIL
ncbi:hypothetical protein C808_03085 [Lachnospiraceae bacterium M18-1]|nr:hypothetical protein C808_03085 [Lachnospiraceae bacterium M18-1]